MYRQPLITAGALFVAICAALFGTAVIGASEEFDDGAIYSVRYPDWFKHSFLSMPEDAAEAADAGKQGLFLFFGTEGCSYCHLFIERSLGDPHIAARLREHFDSIGLEIFSDAEMTDFAGEATRVKTFALKQGVEFAPTLLFFDTKGERLLRLTGYYGPERFERVLDYLSKDDRGDLSLREYLALETAQPADRDATLRPDPLFADPPFALDRSRVSAQRPLLVLFEGIACARCQRFHDEVLVDAGIRQTLEGFDVVRLDAADTETAVLTPAGERTTPATWYETLGFSQLPALAFFSENGKPVLETDALVLESRMNNALGFVRERAYEQGWNYQRYARSQALKKMAN